MKLFGIEKQVPYPKVDYKNLDRDKMFADEAAHQKAVKAYLKQLGFTGKHTGELVKMPVADGYALYMIADGPGKNFGLVHLTYGDGYHYTGIEHMPKAEILKLAEREKALVALFKHSDKFWETRAVGAVVHYHNGFGAYIRGVIVETPKGKAMKPTALVGKWLDSDLPRYDQTGELNPGYYAKKIASGETMTPNESNMYEADPSRFEREGDPRTMEAIDLTPPALKAEQVLLASLTRLRFNVSKVLGNGMNYSAPDQIAETRKALAKAKAMLEDAGF